MNICLEIPPMTKFLIHLNIITKKPLETMDKNDFEFKFNKTSNKHTKRNWQRKIIWFNPPFSRVVPTNVGKRFFQLLRHHFPPSNKLHKIFNKNTEGELLIHPM